MVSLSTYQSWQPLHDHWQTVRSVAMQDLLATDVQRADRYRLSAAGLTLHYAKHRIVDKTIVLLCQWANEVSLSEKACNLFAGHYLNVADKVPVSHTALRSFDAVDVPAASGALTSQVKTTVEKMAYLAARIHEGDFSGVSGETITDVVNLGVGGSDLGPRLVVNALRERVPDAPPLRVHFASNMDAEDLSGVLRPLDPMRTLFIITSKSFSTDETLQNMHLAKRWFCRGITGAVHADEAWQAHCIAVTAHADKARALGFSTEHILKIPQGVSGRYSLWSAVGFPIVLALGMPAFRALLSGAASMDRHFITAPFDSNMPVILGLLGIWYINFWQANTQAILPYCHALRDLVPYVQQLDMESNGKRVDCAGNALDYATGPIIWGGVGSNSQHAFHQHLLQSASFVPVDFLAVRQTTSQCPQARQQHDMLLASCFTQSYALFHGFQSPEAQPLSAHKRVLGNMPSSTILMDTLTPASLGALLALYEHKVFVQSVIWNINAFDQWGIELSKTLTHQAEPGGNFPPLRHERIAS